MATPVKGRSRGVKFSVEFTEAERERFTACAQRLGLGLGPWLRMLAHQACQEPVTPSKEGT
jgi:hypothetical protein